ncbi:hypothetical protein Tco_0520131 [Tanacetum coccineum]
MDLPYIVKVEKRKHITLRNCHHQELKPGSEKIGLAVVMPDVDDSFDFALVGYTKESNTNLVGIADGNLRELSGEEAWEAIENFVQGQKEWDNPPNIISEQKVANLKAQAKRLFGNEDVWVEMHRGIAWDKVENPNPQNTPQVFPLFEEYAPPVTYPEEVEETIGTPIEVEPLDETQLEDLGLNTCNHDI